MMGGFIVLYASWRMGNALDAKLGVYCFVCFLLGMVDSMVVEFRF